jgi:hypothetical protein
MIAIVVFFWGLYAGSPWVISGLEVRAVAAKDNTSMWSVQ